MKKVICALTIAGLWALSPAPAFGVSREIIRIMQQLDTLQQTVQSMQKTIDALTGEVTKAQSYLQRAHNVPASEAVAIGGSRGELALSGPGSRN